MLPLRLRSRNKLPRPLPRLMLLPLRLLLRLTLLLRLLRLLRLMPLPPLRLMQLPLRPLPPMPPPLLSLTLPRLLLKKPRSNQAARHNEKRGLGPVFHCLHLENHR